MTGAISLILLLARHEFMVRGLDAMPCRCSFVPQEYSLSLAQYPVTNYYLARKFTSLSLCAVVFPPQPASFAGSILCLPCLGYVYNCFSGVSHSPSFSEPQQHSGCILTPLNFCYKILSPLHPTTHHFHVVPSDNLPTYFPGKL